MVSSQGVKTTAEQPHKLRVAYKRPEHVSVADRRMDQLFGFAVDVGDVVLLIKDEISGI